LREKIYPEYNTSVLFTTDDSSFHGHPEKLACPEDARRNSIALYYFSPNVPAVNFREKRDGTNYVKRHGWDFFKGVDRIRSLAGKVLHKVQSTDTRR